MTYKDIAVSPSIRREWIEIPLLKEPEISGMSPSIRREWIEMLLPLQNRKDLAGLPPYGGSGLKC